MKIAIQTLDAKRAEARAYFGIDATDWNAMPLSVQLTYIEEMQDWQANGNKYPYSQSVRETLAALIMRGTR